MKQFIENCRQRTISDGFIEAINYYTLLYHNCDKEKLLYSSKNNEYISFMCTGLIALQSRGEIRVTTLFILFILDTRKE
jgi:hypothetical protein